MIRCHTWEDIDHSRRIAMAPRQLDRLMHLGDERLPRVLRLRAIASIGKLVANEVDHKKAARDFDLLVEEVKRS